MAPDMATLHQPAAEAAAARALSWRRQQLVPHQVMQGAGLAWCRDFSSLFCYLPARADAHGNRGDSYLKTEYLSVMGTFDSPEELCTMGALNKRESCYHDVTVLCYTPVRGMPAAGPAGTRPHSPRQAGRGCQARPGQEADARVPLCEL